MGFLVHSSSHLGTFSPLWSMVHFVLVKYVLGCFKTFVAPLPVSLTILPTDSFSVWHLHKEGTGSGPHPPHMDCG